MEIIAVAAVDDKFGLSRKGAIPWKIQEDIDAFWAIVNGYPCIVGRITADAMGRQGRERIKPYVVGSKYGQYPHPYAALRVAMLENEGPVYIVGGENIYASLMPLCSTLILTRVLGNYECDRFLVVDLKSWETKLEDSVVFSQHSRLCMFRKNFPKVG